MKEKLKWVSSAFTTGLWIVMPVGVVGWLAYLILKEIFNSITSIAHLVHGPIFFPGFQILAALIVFLVVGIIARRTNLVDKIRKVLFGRKFGAYQAGLFQKNDFTWELGAIVKIVKTESSNEKNRLPSEMIIGFIPYAPLPWSGLPVTYVAKKAVIPLEMNITEILSVITSLGIQSPEILKYSTEKFWIENH